MTYITTRWRAAFTLVELLVVITVITLMLTLLVGASFRFIGSARESATAATIAKASGIVQDRIRAFREFDFSDAGIVGSDNWNSNSANSGDYISPQVAEVLFRKARFKKAFPQAFKDIQADSGQMNRFFGISSPPSGAPYNSKYEAGIVLYALLLKGETFGATTPAEDTFTGAEVRISDDTARLPCLVDAWGEPLRFYRWPTRLIRCGEQDFDGDGTFDDYNQNGIAEATGGVGSPAIRPFAPSPPSVTPSLSGLVGPTPASLLIANLPGFERGLRAYAMGPDGAPGAKGVNDDGNSFIDWTDSPTNSQPDCIEIGAPDSDDPEPLNTDPDDPTYQLAAWLKDPNVVPAVAANRRTSFVSKFHDYFTFHTPLIVSAGPDKQLGLNEPTDYTPTGGYLAGPIIPLPPAKFADTTMRQLFDNISNLNQRAGGK